MQRPCGSNGEQGVLKELRGSPTAGACQAKGRRVQGEVARGEDQALSAWLTSKEFDASLSTIRRRSKILAEETQPFLCFKMSFPKNRWKTCGFLCPNESHGHPIFLGEKGPSSLQMVSSVATKWFGDLGGRKVLSRRGIQTKVPARPHLNGDCHITDNKWCTGSEHHPPGGWGPAGREKQQRDSVLPRISDWGPEGWNYSQMHFSPLLTFFFIT